MSSLPLVSRLCRRSRSRLTIVGSAFALTSTTLAETAATWEDVDLWAKWPEDLHDATSPHVQGHWSPLVEIETGSLFYGVHAALLYDGQYERLVLMRTMQSCSISKRVTSGC